MTDNGSSWLANLQNNRMKFLGQATIDVIFYLLQAYRVIVLVP
jgi:hypothetical protein